MNIPRHTPDETANGTYPPPDKLDYLEFDYQGITFRCFGILHGITGGLNQDYVRFVKHSIRHVDGAKLAEKGMKQLYRNCDINEELEDWMVLRDIDCLVMGFQLLADPRCLWMITVDALREKLRKHDPYITNKRQITSDLGESPYFHYIEEYQRRELVGFLPSNEAISKDLKSMSHWHGAILPTKRHTTIDHPQWKRILLLERLMHIPCRSIHMLHYALAYAKQHNHEVVNLFVGETHNTDMHYLAKNMGTFRESLSARSEEVMNRIVDRATYFGERRNWKSKPKLVTNKFRYLLFLLAGATLPATIYLAILAKIALL